MTDKRIEPALTARQWEDGAYYGADVTIWRVLPGVAGNTRLDIKVESAPMDNERDFAALIALANAALPDSDPRKLTPAKILLLREAVRYFSTTPYREWSMGLAEFADALESYLPPEER